MRRDLFIPGFAGFWLRRLDRAYGTASLAVDPPFRFIVGLPPEVPVRLAPGTR